MSDLGQVICVCECSLLDHVVRFHPADEDGVVYVEVSLSSGRGFWQRLATAWRYLFGGTCRFGHVSEVLLQGEALERAAELFRKATEKTP